MKKIAALSIIILFFVACATAEVGRKFDTTQTDQITIGKTTESEVISMLGQPIAIKRMANGEKSYGYIYGSAKITPFSHTGTGQKFSILFDKNGIVKDIGQSKI